MYAQTSLRRPVYVFPSRGKEQVRRSRDMSEQGTPMEGLPPEITLCRSSYILDSQLDYITFDGICIHGVPTVRRDTMPLSTQF